MPESDATDDSKTAAVWFTRGDRNLRVQLRELYARASSFESSAALLVPAPIT